MNDGGAAFPTNFLNVPFADADNPKYQGMTLLDWFAGKALSGFLPYASKGLWPAEEVARRTFNVAQAMLAERKRLQEKNS